MQLVTSKSIIFFDQAFRKKFGFSKYTDTTKPCLFLGIYRRGDIRMVQRHKGIKIVWFAGSDAMKDEVLSIVKNDNGFKDAIIIAESKWIQYDLDRFGIPHENITLFMDDMYNWRPTPLGDCLYWYNADKEKYGGEYYERVRKEFPDLNIIVHNSLSVPRSKMSEIYKQCFAGIRPVAHDGMSQTVAEMGLMGRMSIWNGGGPFSVPYSNIYDIIAAIRNLREANYNYKLVAKRTRGFFIDGESKWADLILRLCGTAELDHTNIFDEDKKRSGSLFRIARKSDIEKIGGFGQDQFERPFFCRKMIELNRKQLIVSKNSGFIAIEFKNADRKKGYLGGVDFLTRDGRTI